MSTLIETIVNAIKCDSRANQVKLYRIFEKRILPNGDDSLGKTETINPNDVCEFLETRFEKLTAKGWIIKPCVGANPGFLGTYLAKYVTIIHVERVYDFTLPLPALPVETPKAKVRDGIFTVERKGAAHKTFRIKTVKQGTLKGKVIVEYLSGSDNDKDYTGCAFITANGNINVWRKFSQATCDEFKACIEAIIHDVDEAGERYARESGRCSRCNRTLTVPASLNRGLGPECATKV